MCQTLFTSIRFNGHLQLPVVAANARVSFDEYIICEYGLKEEIAKVFGPSEGESRVTRPQNIKTPSASAAPATQFVLFRAGKTLSCDMSYSHAHTHTHTHIYPILYENGNKMYPYIETSRVDA